jgi:hypothetical protein
MRTFEIGKRAKTPFRLAFPAILAGKWMPGLFPDPPP